jgi:molybdenum cofactor cytidylyltransferase
MVDVILLISGSSKRMGNEKALLPFNKTKNFVCQLLMAYSKLQDSHIFIVVNKNNEVAIKHSCAKFIRQITFVLNPNPEKGRLSSIVLGLGLLKQDRGAFIQNIDNPFTSVDLLRAMLKNYQPDSFLVPQFNGKNGHPLLLGAHLVHDLKSKLGTPTDLKSFLNSQNKRSHITQEKAILANINCPEEFQKWFPNLVMEN